MTRILFGVRECRPNARFGLDIKEVWGRCLKLSSVRRSSTTNEKGSSSWRPMDQDGRWTRRRERQCIKPARNRTKHNQGRYRRMPAGYAYLDAVRDTFWPRKSLYFARSAQSPGFSCGGTPGNPDKPSSRPGGKGIV